MGSIPRPHDPARDLLNARQVRLLLEDTYSITYIYRQFNVGRKKLGPNRVRWSRKAILKWLEDLEDEHG